MAKRKGTNNFPCENLVEHMIGAAPLSVADICKTTLPEMCGYECTEDIARHVTIRTALKMMVREGVLIEEDMDGNAIIYGGYKRKRPMAFYYVNPVLAGICDGQEMRRVMAEKGFGTKDYVATAKEANTSADGLLTGSAKSAGQWSKMFKVLNKRAAFA